MVHVSRGNTSKVDLLKGYLGQEMKTTGRKSIAQQQEWV
jgi:hypothetical protein